MVTIEKIDLGDFVRLAILSCIEISYNWPVAIVEFNFSTCALGVKDLCCGRVRHSKRRCTNLLKQRKSVGSSINNGASVCLSGRSKSRVVGELLFI